MVPELKVIEKGFSFKNYDAILQRVLFLMERIGKSISSMACFPLILSFFISVIFNLENDPGTIRVFFF